MAHRDEAGPRLVGEPFVANEYGDLWMLQLAIGRYVEGGVAVLAYCADTTTEQVARVIEGKRPYRWAQATPGECFAKVSVNVPSVALAEGEFVVSHDISAGMRGALIRHFEDTGRTASYGHVIDRPVWAVRPEWL